MRRSIALTLSLMAALATGLRAQTSPKPATAPTSPAAAASPTAPTDPPEEFAGVWQDVADAKHYLEIESGRMRELHVYPQGAELEFARTVYDGDHALRSVWGRRTRWEFSFEQEDLVVTAPKLSLRLRKMSERPAALDPVAVTLGAPAALAKERLDALTAEFAKRHELDQAVRTDPKRVPEMERVDADNTAWLKRLVGELGWIDVTRFGKESALAAFLIVQHSGDLPLMMAALPEIERDVRQHGLDPQNYALLWDRLQIRLGKRQRYGSQLGSDAQGRMVVIALEDRENVEALRKAIGLFPLKQYLEMMRSDPLTPAGPLGAAPKVIVFEDDEKE